MSSAAKALTLLSLFSTDRPEIGLSQLCRIAGRDKATTYRHLQALETVGFVEKNPATRRYRLGPAVLQLAQARETTVPRKEGARRALSALAGVTGESAHAAVISGQTLYRLCECESPRHGIRAVIDLDTFPLHATASGLCALAFGSPDLFDVAKEALDGFTATTPTTVSDLNAAIDRTRASGFGHANQTYEDGIRGLSTPIFDHTGHLAGTVAVACVAARFTTDLERTIKSGLMVAAREITRNWGGTIPFAIEAAWATPDTIPNAMELTS